MLGTQEQILINALNKILRQKFSKQANIPSEIIPHEDIVDVRSGQKDVDPLDISYLENDLARLLLLFGNTQVKVSTEDNEEHEISISDFIISDLDNDSLNFENKIYQSIVQEIKNAKEKSEVLNVAYFTNHPNPAMSSIAIELITSQYELSENWEKNKIFVKKEEDDLFHLALSTLMSFKSRLISKKLNDISKQLKVATDDAEIYLLQQEFFELKKLTNLIDAELNRPFNY